VIPFQPGFARPDLHYRGEWLGIHYVAFTNILLVCSRPLGFTSHTNTVLLRVLGTCSQMLRLKNKATQKMLNIKILRPPKHYFP
jgi:hypothetical protein